MPWTCLQTEQRDWDSVRAGKDMLNTEAMIEPTLHADPEVGSEGADADCWATGGLRGVLSGQQKNPNFGIAGWTVSFHLEKTRLS